MSRQVVAPDPATTAAGLAHTAAGPATEPSALWAWVRVIVSTLCKAVLATVVALAMWAALPAAIGWQPTTVSSGSMLPRLHVGDIAVSRPLEGPPALDQVLLYDDPDHPGKLRLHRFIRIDAGRMVTKGDANPNEDSTAITLEQVRGVGTLRVPYIGLPIVWVREAQWVKLSAAAAALIVLMAGSGLDRRLRAQYGEEDSRSRPDGKTDGDGDGGLEGPDADAGPPPASRVQASRTGPPPTGGGPRDDVHAQSSGAPPSRPATAGWRRWTPAARVTAAAVAGLTAGSLLVTTIGVPAAASYSDTNDNPSSRWSAAPHYTCRAPALALNPYLFYALDEAGNTDAVADTSGNNRNGSFIGGVTAGVKGACGPTDGTAVTLNGSTGYVSTPSSLSAPNVFTLQTWFNTTTTRGGKLLGFGSARTGTSSSYDRHVYMADTGRLYFGVETSLVSLLLQRNVVSSGAAYNDGEWHLVTATLSGSGMRLYVDGSLVASNASATSGDVYTGYWRIGYDSLGNWPSTPSSRFFGGALDNVAVYTKALSAADVAAVFAARG